MGKQKYSVDFKLQVVRKYEQGVCGYKRLAHEFNLPSDTVRDWCLNPSLQAATQMARKNKINHDKDLEYYKTAAIFWEQYAKNIEAELAKQGKKKILLKTMRDYYRQQKANRKSLPRNILNRNFESTEPLKKFCTDVSYFKTKTGWLYLSPVLDLCGRKVQCYSISHHNDDALSEETLDKFFLIGNLKGSILHSDQGALYTSKKWRNRLNENGVIQSMSRRGNCWDNACMEHFFGTLKVESGYDDILKSRKFLSFEETKKLIDDFIEYYNNDRIQKNLGWKTPNEAAA